MALGRFQVYGGSFNVSLESFCLEEEQFLFSQSKLDAGSDLFDGFFWREWALSWLVHGAPLSYGRERSLCLSGVGNNPCDDQR
jgi:hypothetical protein